MNAPSAERGISTVFLISCLAACAGPSNRVVSVSDGDTVTVLRDGTAVKVRLAGIDAPESKQASGQASK
jgi:micrococcal nuclease